MNFAETPSPRSDARDPLYTIQPYAPELLPAVGAPGTGGVESDEYYLRRKRSPFGYSAILVVVIPVETSGPASFVELMQEIQAGFGRTMVHLPCVFDVSRQTLYNWLNGEEPKPTHHEKLRQLANAARFFTETRFIPTAITLNRTISQGKSFLQMLNEGADGRATADQLVRIVYRGNAARFKVNEMLKGRQGRIDEFDIGVPHLNEDV